MSPQNNKECSCIVDWLTENEGEETNVVVEQAHTRLGQRKTSNEPILDVLCIGYKTVPESIVG